MKKLSIFAVAFAAMVFAACGGKKANQAAEVTDSVKTFEQEQIEASIKMHVDSLANEIGKLKQLPVIQANNGAIKLTKDELKVKPDYLLAPSVAESATTLAEKYRILAAFDDDAAANSTFRIVLILDALNRLSQYDPDIKPVAEALAPLDVLNATTVKELKAQLAEAKDKIEAARAALVK